jgi:hypothetical protein
MEGLLKLDIEPFSMTEGKHPLIGSKAPSVSLPYSGGIYDLKPGEHGEKPLVLFFFPR